MAQLDAMKADLLAANALAVAQAADRLQNSAITLADHLDNVARRKQRGENVTQELLDTVARHVATTVVNALAVGDLARSTGLDTKISAGISTSQATNQLRLLKEEQAA